MRSKQSLINAQIDVNRSVFEINKENPSPEYLKIHVRSAIDALSKFYTENFGHQLDMFSQKAKRKIKQLS